MTVHQLIPKYAVIYEHEDSEHLRYELDDLDPEPPEWKRVGIRVNGVNHAVLEFEEQRLSADILNLDIFRDPRGKL